MSELEELRARLVEVERDNERLLARQQELLATIVRVTNETPFSDEAKDALEQRGKLVAEIGTLKSKTAELEAEIDRMGAEAARYVGVEGFIERMAGRLKRARDNARAAFDQLRNDIDGYDMCFEHARWIAEGRPCSFDEWLKKYEGNEWETWKP